MFGKKGRGPAVELGQDHAERLAHYTRIELDLWPDHDGSEKADRALLKKLERIIGAPTKLIVLDDKGTGITSEGLAERIRKMQNTGVQQLIFVIGGAYGVPQVLKQRADMMLSLSKMTFPHQFARAMLLEQLYRAYTILGGQKYHH